MSPAALDSIENRAAPYRFVRDLSDDQRRVIQQMRFCGREGNSRNWWKLWDGHRAR